MTVPAWLDRAEYPFAPRWLDLPAGRMHYVDEGQGRPIVFVHGTPDWSFVWRHLIKALRPRYRCIAPDNLGFGLSDKPPGLPRTRRPSRRPISARLIDAPRPARRHAGAPRLRRAVRPVLRHRQPGQRQEPGPAEHVDVVAARRSALRALRQALRRRARPLPLPPAELLRARHHEARHRGPGALPAPHPGAVRAARSAPRPSAWPPTPMPARCSAPASGTTGSGAATRRSATFRRSSSGA